MLFPIYFRSMSAILNSQHTLTSGSNLNSLSALPDQENFGTAIGISFQSFIRAEIQDIAFLLPVNGGHLRFTSHSDVGEYPQ